MDQHHHWNLAAALGHHQTADELDAAALERRVADIERDALAGFPPNVISPFAQSEKETDLPSGLPVQPKCWSREPSLLLVELPGLAAKQCASAAYRLPMARCRSPAVAQPIGADMAILRGIGPGRNG